MVVKSLNVQFIRDTEKEWEEDEADYSIREF
jgi:hypothetical protein